MAFPTRSERRSMSETTATAGDVTARYAETGAERRLTFERTGGAGAGGRSVAIAQNLDGYAMLMVRVGGPDGDEVERYYGLDMALDHAAELLGVAPSELPVPDAAADMGM